MSVYFRVHCDTDDVDGPQIRRSAGYVGLDGTRPTDATTADAEWMAFLIEHEWCGLRLVHE